MVSKNNPDTETPREIQSPPPVQKKASMDSGNEVPPPPMRKLSRSQSITSSAIPSSFFLPPEMENQWKRRRESLEKLQLDKVAPWMHLHDFTSEGDNLGQESSSANSPWTFLSLLLEAEWIVTLFIANQLYQSEPVLFRTMHGKL
jgi:hypothetical protein